MAGFSLRGGGGGGGGVSGGGGRGGERGGGDHAIGADSLFLYARGAAAAASDTAGSGGGGGGIGFQLWHPHQQAAAAAAAAPHTSQFFSSGLATGVVLGFSSHDGGGGHMGGPGGGAGAGGGRAGTSCQDCGNNAKKDCSHLRCRTCCRSRGFSCATHVKSTWVPAAKRRERQQQLAALFRGAAANNSAAAAAAAASKRPRELVRSLGRLPSANTAMVATTTSSGEGDGRFPPELSVEAVFRCVRIGAVDEADAELAYQTAVSIGGHTFKGILRDHGPADEAAGQLPPSSAEYHQLTGQGREESSPAGSSEGVGGGHGAATVATSAAVLMDPYPTPIGAFAAGTQFFPHNPRT